MKKPDISNDVGKWIYAQEEVQAVWRVSESVTGVTKPCVVTDWAVPLWETDMYPRFTELHTAAQPKVEHCLQLRSLSKQPVG